MLKEILVNGVDGMEQLDIPGFAMNVSSSLA